MLFYVMRVSQVHVIATYPKAVLVIYGLTEALKGDKFIRIDFRKFSGNFDFSCNIKKCMISWILFRLNPFHATCLFLYSLKTLEN